MRYFRAGEATYEAVRAAIDAANGWPDEGTQTSVEPAATAPRDAEGRVLLACEDWLVERAGHGLAALEAISEQDYVPAADCGVPRQVTPCRDAPPAT
jgi:hypothetical protein